MIIDKSCMCKAHNIPDDLDQHHACRADALTLKHQETHRCIVSTVATDALVLKHQAITIHNAD